MPVVGHLPIHGLRLNPVDYEALAVGNVAVGPTKRTARTAAIGILIQAPAGPLNYFVHGATPTAALGMPAWDGKEWMVNDLEAINLLLIRTTSQDGVAHLTYYERY